ncbi:MAG: NAD(P)-dependent oxidoreductase [Burkholderiaceae bacterium]|nr:NAD(P)-dependent oxidoreductase [Burkholderiaceae bacterium]
MTRPVRRVAVVGASSQIGRFLLPRLRQAGFEAAAIGRGAREPDAGAGAVHVYEPGSGRFVPPLASADALVNLAPLPIIDQVVEMARSLGVSRMIAFGSSGRFSKQDAEAEIERDFVAQQIAAEEAYRRLAEGSGIAWTLFRPTMVYGAGLDLNVAFIRRFIRQFHCFPVPIGAHGLRQPVHADDLAAACVAALDCRPSFGRAYNLGGGETLDYPAMVRRLFRAEGRTPILLPVPLRFYRAAIRTARRWPRFAFVTEDMAARAFRDLIVDHADAVRDFGYAPRGFHPTGIASKAT